MVSQFRNHTNSVDSMESQDQITSSDRLHQVQKKIYRVLELAGVVMEELSNSSGHRVDIINNHYHEFMQSIKDIHVNLREEIKITPEYSPFEKCDYSSRIGNEICSKKLEYVIEQLDSFMQTIKQYHVTV